MAGSFKIDPAEISKILGTIDGPVGRYLSERATRLQLAAKKQIARGNGGWSSEGNRTRNLSDHVVKRPTVTDGVVSVLVGVWGVPYASYVHTGRPGFKKPTVGSKKVFVFQAKGVTIFTRKVGPQAPNRFLADNLKLVVEE